MCCSRASVRCSSWSAGRHLQDDRPRGQRVLQGEEDPPRRPAPELGHEPEPAQNLTHFGKAGDRRLQAASGAGSRAAIRARPATAGTGSRPRPRSTSRPASWRRHTSSWIKRSADSALELGMAVEKRLGRRLFPPPPRGHHLFHELRRERERAGTGRRVDVETELGPRSPEGWLCMGIAGQVVEVSCTYEECLTREKFEPTFHARTAASLRARS